MQKAAAEKRLSKKENPVNTSTTGHATLGENDLPTTKVVAETHLAEGTTQAANNEENTSKRKEVPNLDKDKIIKRPRIKMAAKKKSGESEISRIELHGAGEPDVLTLYAGETVVPPSTERAVEEIQEEVREFIPQVSTKITCLIVCESVIN